MILFITWIFVDQSFIFFSDVLIQTWQIWINFFHYTADVHTTYKLNWRSSFRTLIKGCVWIFNPIITIFTVVFPSKECFLFTKKMIISAGLESKITTSFNPDFPSLILSSYFLHFVKALSEVCYVHQMMGELFTSIVMALLDGYILIWKFLIYPLKSSMWYIKLS